MPNRLHSEDGFTLVEMLVAMVMGLLVTIAAVMFLVSIMHRQPKTTSSADVIGHARNAEEKITADIRVGEKATLVGPAELQVEAQCAQVGAAGTGSCTVTYACVTQGADGTYDCTRSVSSEADPAGTAETLVSGLASDQGVFCVYPTSEVNPTSGKESECGPETAERKPLYVGVKVELPNYEGSQSNTVLEDGAALHNAPELLGG
jgi:Tfp pilus assembly protein PilW